MIQSNLENEQFNLFPNVFTNNRSRNGFITTDRPDSSQLVDLHIYIIPRSVWKNIQHLAQNEAMDDAISAGFVRVSPDMKLHNLRESIEKLCGTESYFPREFIFLRSVGRCLTRVKQTQENQLKVKNYRPPQTFAPEIYLLEGRHEDYSNIPSASPALSSASYLFGNRYHSRLNIDDFDRSPSRLTRQYNRKPLHADKKRLPTKNTFIPKTESKSLTRLTQISSDFDELSPKELFKLKEEQERLRRRQAELERMRRAVEGGQPQRSRRQDKTQLESDRRRRQETDENERRRRQENDENERRRRHLEQEEKAATKIQASFRGYKDRQAFRDRQKNTIENNSRKSSIKSNKTIENEKKTDINDDELSYGSQILSRSSSIGSTSDVDSNLSRPETRTIKKDIRESIASNSSVLSIPNNIDDDENIRTTTVTKIRHSDEEILSPSIPDIDNDDTYELERRATETKRRQQSIEDKQKAKELEEQKRRELAKPKQREDLESLRKRLQELRTGRIDFEKVRDEVIRHLKYMHNRITLRRKEARDMWKKKYFHEKKKTPPMDEQATQLKATLKQIHTKIVQTIDNECKHTAQTGYVKEAEVGNVLLQITRMQHEIQDIRNQVDQAKLRLTTDIKLRNQAENESRTLKHELTQAKMNLNHIKNRIEIITV